MLETSLSNSSTVPNAISYTNDSRKARITCTDIGLAAGGPVSVSEPLCPSSKNLLGQPISKKKEIKRKLVLVKNGSSFARKSEDTRVVKIASTGDF